MIQSGTFLQVVDNLAIKEIKSIKILSGPKKKGKLGDILVVSIKRLHPKKVKNSELKKGSLALVTIMQTNAIINRLDGQKIKYAQNAAVLVDKNKKIISAKIDSPVCKEFRKKRSIKFINSNFQTI